MLNFLLMKKRSCEENKKKKKAADENRDDKRTARKKRQKQCEDDKMKKLVLDNRRGGEDHHQDKKRKEDLASLSLFVDKIDMISISGEKRRRLEPLSTVIMEENNKGRAMVKEDVIVTEKEEKKKKKKDIEFEFVNESSLLLKKRLLMKYVIFMAIDLYLDPVNVMKQTLYWISGYNNKKKPECLLFNDHIHKLIINPVELSFTSSRNVPTITFPSPKYTLLLKFAASDLHKIPFEFFVSDEQTTVLLCFKTLLLPENDFFTVKNNFGLNGEIEVDGFRYNKLLNYFYEVSFYIITSYMIYIHYLLADVNGPLVEELHIRQIDLICEPLMGYKEGRIASISPENSNYVDKLARFKEDMRLLHEALKIRDCDIMKESLRLLWTDKATYMHSEKDVRFNEIYSQLHGKEEEEEEEEVICNEKVQ